MKGSSSLTITLEIKDFRNYFKVDGQISTLQFLYEIHSMILE